MLVKAISSTVFGSAVAGFGFSLGKDVYKSAKGKNGGGAIIAILAILSILGSYCGGLFVSRNYKSIFISLLMTILGLIFTVISGGFLAIVLGTSLALPPIISFGVPAFIFLIGFLVGFAQRKKRRFAWEAEKYNANFLTQNGFTEQDGFIIDRNGQKYRVENTTPNHIELFPIRRRGKRGYLRLDNTGKISNWSGMVKI